MLHRRKTWAHGEMDKERPSSVNPMDGPKAYGPAPRPEPFPWVHLTATFFILLLFSWLGIDLSRQSDGVATIWFTNGLLFAMVITRPRKVWAPYFLVGFAADT